MDLPLIELDLTGLSHSEIFGDNHFELAFSTPAKLSRFSRTFLNLDGEMHEMNGIVFINEVDKLLNNVHDPKAESIKTALLELLDSDRPEFRVNDLKLPFDVSRFLFVIVGNERIESTALEDRMTIVEFEGYDLEAKQEIIKKHFLKQAAKINRTVAETHLQVVDALIKYSHTEKKHKSLRTPFKVIELYLEWLGSAKGETSFNYQEKLDLFTLPDRKTRAQAQKEPQSNEIEDDLDDEFIYEEEAS